ncbi:MAG: dienelactone hydrolase family protein [Myxococcales bacterium]|nr:dienelactone hydrolase family protein [Myxococcales bacterium]
MMATTMGMIQSATAEIKHVPLEYEATGITLKGDLYYDDSIKERRPGVLVVHEWWGLNDHARNSAKKLAEAGYVAFALDMYGKGKQADHPDQAGAFVKEATKDAATAGGRFMAAVELLKKQEQTDPGRIGAIGYCFGGAIVLEMARRGTDLRGVVSFHGSLSPFEAAKAGEVKAKILVCHGAKDPLIPAEAVSNFIGEMEHAGADYQFISYGGTQHSFTNPEADKRGIPGLAYNEASAKRSWDHMTMFLKEVFAR